MYIYVTSNACLRGQHVGCYQMTPFCLWNFPCVTGSSIYCYVNVIDSALEYDVEINILQILHDYF